MLHYVSADEIEKAKILWLRAIQNFKDLENCLCLRVDDNGLIVQQEGYYKENLCRKILENQLNKNNELACLIVIDTHEKIKHRGERNTLSEVRSQF